LVNRARAALALALLGACAEDAVDPSSSPGAGGTGAGGAGSSGAPSSAAPSSAAQGGGAGGELRYDGPPLPWPHEAFPELPADVEPVTEAKTTLGRMLFYDPILSGDRKVACLTCHSEQWGLSDGLPTSIGVGGVGPVGPGRTGPTPTTRNAPTLWNVAYRGALFWDGRSSSLEEQALEPLRSPIELGLDPEEAAARVRAIPAYVTLFEAAFPDEAEPISPATLARALATLQRTFISRRAPYDQYTGGDAGALDDETRAGMRLFASAGCAGCHAPPLFASDLYADRGIASGDPGRGAITGQEGELRAFRVPTLRNVRDTEPYFHDGSVASLEDAVAHEVARQVAAGASATLDEAEVGAIVRFVKKALQDTSESPDRPGEVPSGLAIPEDGFRIPR